MSRPWSVLDFFLVILGGLLGALLASTLAVVDGGEVPLLLALVGQYLGHVLVFWLLARAKDDPDVGLQLEGRDARYLIVGLLLQLVLAVVFLPLTNLLLPDTDSAQQIGDFISTLETPLARMAAIVIAALIAPVVEELMFRGVLLKALAKHSRNTILVVTSGVFALFHLLGLDPSRFFSAAAVVLPQLFIVGLTLGWVTIRSGRLGPAIFLHSGFNLLAAIALLLPPELLESVGG